MTQPRTLGDRRETNMRLVGKRPTQWIAAAAAALSGVTGLQFGAHAKMAEEQVVERNVFVPMRDGARLATDLYRPQSGDGRWPVVLVRTPYGKWGGYVNNSRREELTRFFTQRGYAVAIQDVRGRFGSEGSFRPSFGDDKDGYDTVEWLAKQPWSTGKIGMIGCSYEGDVQIFAAGERPPHLAAIIPQASGSSVGSAGGLYRYFGTRVGGVNEWAGAIGWFAQSGASAMPRLPADLPRDQYNRLAAQWGRPQPPTVDYQKAWWHLPMSKALDAVAAPPSEFENTVSQPPSASYWAEFPYMQPNYRPDVPALFVNSWYDFGAETVLFQYGWFRKHSVSAAARDNQYAIMSPHAHCEFLKADGPETIVGSRSMGDARLDYWRLYEVWFDAWLKNDAAALAEVRAWPRIRYFAMGRNRWQAAADWPLPAATEHTLYLSSRTGAQSLFGDGRLTQGPPTADVRATDEFTYDPMNPVPSRGGAMCCTGTADAAPGALDQRVIEARADVLVYTSDPLPAEVELTGNPQVTLYVSSSAVDTDFTAKLVDVHPDGRAYNVLEGVMRARYRQGFQSEVWMQKNAIYELVIPLGATSNVFMPGHRIRLEISSSNFPRFERNLNMGGNNTKQRQWAVAANVIHHSPRYPSRLTFPVAPAKAN